ncbi:hypothetical protein [Nonomuraea wenchangensis]|uniref:Uncharacterized protein n=1 Tax=Nonomuraea wenchangensis TaxID=568860 RepID=A0A1I0F5D1_9ACTN|nr:hypothetical protein [Nonomuraea wenchangensis]SET52433.1 hypothetical protein SAMN05421811_103307 [Nonomuraea wenchangensis]
MSDYPEIAKRFAMDTRWHKMTVLHNDGLYRHLRCRGRRGLYWFDIVTWPGSLAIRGDLNDAYVFSRTPDMFQFFRARRSKEINPDYWAEKLPEGRHSVQKYSQDLLHQHIRQALRDEYEDFLHARLTERASQLGLDTVNLLGPELAKPCHEQTRDHMRRLRKAVHEHFFDPWWGCGTEYEETVLRGLDEFSFTSDDGHKFQFEGWQEWDLRDWDWSFLWACHAIVWGVQRYDAVKSAEKAEASA